MGWLRRLSDALVARGFLCPILDWPQRRIGSASVMRRLLPGPRALATYRLQVAIGILDLKPPLGCLLSNVSLASSVSCLVRLVAAEDEHGQCDAGVVFAILRARACHGVFAAVCCVRCCQRKQHALCGKLGGVACVCSTAGFVGWLGLLVACGLNLWALSCSSQTCAAGAPVAVTPRARA